MGYGRAPSVDHDASNTHTHIGSDQACLRHEATTVYRCFLPDLTGFTGRFCTGPDLQRLRARAGSAMPDLGREFSPAGADCGYRAPLAPRLARPSRCYRARRSGRVLVFVSDASGDGRESVTPSEARGRARYDDRGFRRAQMAMRTEPSPDFSTEARGKPSSGRSLPAPDGRDRSDRVAGNPPGYPASRCPLPARAVDKGGTRPPTATRGGRALSRLRRSECREKHEQTGHNSCHHVDREDLSHPEIRRDSGQACRSLRWNKSPGPYVL
jgi:hypothetical protein